MKRNNKKKYTVLIMSVLLISISIGYALLSSSLNIGGTSSINNPKWDIHFENIQVKYGSVTATTPATINASKNTVTYAVTLNTPGEFYEFTVDVKNSGTIDGMIKNINTTINGLSPSELPAYMEYSLTYDDDIEIQNNHLLYAGEKETYKIRIGFKKDVNLSDLPSETQAFNININAIYGQADSSAYEREKAIYYYRYSDKLLVLGGIFDDEYSNNYDDLSEEIFLRHRLDDSNHILNSDIGFFYNEEVHFLIGDYAVYEEGYYADHYDENKQLLLNLFGSDKCTIENDTHYIMGDLYDNSYSYEYTECHDGYYMARVSSIAENIFMSEDLNYGCVIEDQPTDPVHSSYCVSHN